MLFQMDKQEDVHILIRRYIRIVRWLINTCDISTIVFEYLAFRYSASFKKILARLSCWSSTTASCAAASSGKQLFSSFQPMIIDDAICFFFSTQQNRPRFRSPPTGPLDAQPVPRHPALLQRQNHVQHVESAADWQGDALLAQRHQLRRQRRHVCKLRGDI